MPNATPVNCPDCGAPIPPDAPMGLCIACVLQLVAEDFHPQEKSGVVEQKGPVGGFDDYELIREIGRGGMGIVFEAHQRSLNRRVAIKLVLGGQFASELDVIRFKKEAEAIAALDDSHIVPIYEIGERDGHHYYSMKLLSGGSLATNFDRFRGNTHSLVLLLTRITRAVQKAHGRGIVHRDLKPENILFDSLGSPFVTDFGLAWFADRERGLTRAGLLACTPEYTAPERISGQTRLHSSDIWSLGVIFYRLLAGRLPFFAATPAGVFKAVCESDPIAPGAVVRKESRGGAGGLCEVPQDLETICLKCLEKDPARRYASAADLADDLERWLRGEPVKARPISATELGWRWVKRRPAVALSLALAAVVGAVGFLAVYNESGRLRHTVGELRLTQANELLRTDRTAEGLRLLAKEVREFPRDRMAAQRLISAIARRPFLWPAADLAVRASHGDFTIWSPDSQWLAVASDADGEPPFTVTLLNRTNGVVTIDRSFPRPRRDIVFSPDSKWLAVAASNSIAVFNTSLSPAPGRDLPGIGKPVSMVFASDQTLWVADETVELKRWKVDSGASLPSIRVPAGARMISLCTSNNLVGVLLTNGVILLSSGSMSGTWTNIFDLDPFSETLSLNARGDRLLVFGTSTNEVRDVILYDVNARISLYKGRCLDAAFSPDGRWIAMRPDEANSMIVDAMTAQAYSAGWAELVCVPSHAFTADSAALFAQPRLSMAMAKYRVPDGHRLSEPAIHEMRPTDVAVSPNGLFAATTCNSSNVVVWSTSPSQTVATIPNFGTETVAINRSWTHLMAWRSNVVQEWDLGRFKSSGGPLVQSNEVYGCSFDRFGNLFGVANHTNLTLHDLSKAGTATVNLGFSDKVICFDFSPDSRIVAVGASQHWIHFRDTLSGEQTRAPFEVDTGYRPVWWSGGVSPVCLKISPDGIWAGVGLYTGEVQLWRMAEGVRVYTFVTDGPVMRLAFSPDSTRLAAGSLDTTARLWSLQTGEPLGPPMRHFDIVFHLEFSPDGKKLITASGDGNAILWDAYTAREIAEIGRQGQRIYQASFSPDGRIFATIAPDLGVAFWDADTALQVGEWFASGPGGDRFQVIFSPDGKRLLAAGRSIPASIINVPPAPNIAPEWLGSLGDALSGGSVPTSGNPESISGIRQLIELRMKIAALGKKDPVAAFLVPLPNDQARVHESTHR